MPVNMQSTHGNWVHLHQHPCISIAEMNASLFCGAFFVSGGQFESSQAVRVTSRQGAINAHTRS